MSNNAIHYKLTRGYFPLHPVMPVGYLFADKMSNINWDQLKLIPRWQKKGAIVSVSTWYKLVEKQATALYVAKDCIF